MIKVYQNFNDSRKGYSLANNQYVLTECISATMTETLNGNFILELEYPAQDSKNISNMLQVSNFLTVGMPENDDRKAAQIFYITKVSREFNNGIEIISVCAIHEFMKIAQQNYITDRYFVNSNISSAMQQLTDAQNIIPAAGFRKVIKYNIHDTESDFATAVKNLRIVRKNVWDAITGKEDNTILNRYGGEFMLDNSTIHLYEKRGEVSQVNIAYAKNITGAEMDIDITNMYTAIIPEGRNGLIGKTVYSDRHGYMLSVADDGSEFNYNKRTQYIQYESGKAVVNKKNYYMYLFPNGKYYTLSARADIEETDHTVKLYKSESGDNTFWKSIPVSKVYFDDEMETIFMNENIARATKINFDIGVVEEIKDSNGNITNANDVCTQEQALEKLQKAAEKKFSMDHIDEPVFTLDIDIIELADCETFGDNDYKELLEKNKLCVGDTINIYIKSFGIQGQGRVLQLVTNAITGKTEKIKIGNTDFSFIKDIKNDIENRFNILNKAITNNDAASLQRHINVSNTLDSAVDVIELLQAHIDILYNYVYSLTHMAAQNYYIAMGNFKKEHGNSLTTTPVPSQDGLKTTWNSELQYLNNSNTFKIDIHK